ncbi:bifunctional 3-demethylubiquinone-9 3-methyltransferase/ 2-octaprenyl-6-hydroxy phenol methylase [Sinorhizobium sp. KGO-5]|uniref:class I SAM-dependent methyltransferase n=1 Tax=Sinorhizobium sp. KGO-5 TaxID=1470810 RepID=UPI002949066B|nr:bifunctional 3-demethylubiquinone-9 3-methyltransferase/ 2-octaprenyl-6-hydroxy phenol methylase [Sinorhizobium sp. KGO-5]
MTATENEQKKLSLIEAHAYWEHPDDGMNSPLEYLLDSETNRRRNESLLSVFEKHVDHTDSILEIGCNAGRNLQALYRAGYHKLSAIEISQDAIGVMRKYLPELYSRTEITVGPIEDIIKTIPKTRHDVILTMAVLVHLPPESEWVLKEIAKRAKKKIIIFEPESKTADSPRHFPRKYKQFFQQCRRPQIEQWWPVPGLPKSYICRVFGPRNLP